MHNLFTPVEVIRNTSHSYPPEALLRFEQELYAITQPRILSLADERKKLLVWFRGLPLLQRRHVATFNSPQFACMLGRLFEEWQMAPAPLKYQFFMREGKYFAKGQKCYKDYRHKEKELLEQVMLVTKSQLYEAITLSQRLLKEPEWLFELLDELQGGVVDTLADFDPQERATGQISFKIEAQSQAKLLGVWIGTLILKQIALWFLIGIQKIELLCSHHRNQEKQYASLWSQLSAEQKQKLVRSAFGKSEREMLTEYSESVQVCFEWLPRVYFQSTEKHCLSKWIDCPPKQLINEVTYIPLVEAFLLKSIYRMELIIEIQSTIAEKKQVKSKKKNKKKKRRQNYSDDKPQQQLQNNLPEQVSRELKCPTPQALTLKQLIHQAALHSTQEQIKPIQSIVSQTKSSNAHHLQNLRQQPKTILSKVKTDELNAGQRLECLFKKIKEDNRQRNRKIILHRLIHILAKVGISCKPYGSFASQLSLPDSDLDISVNTAALNFLSFQYQNHRSQVILSLQFIANILKHYSWINNFSLLDRAKVPLLSFSADASVYFELGPEEKTKFRVNTKKIDPDKALVQVDLTVQPFANTPQLPHCGLQSTQSLKAWIQIYPSLEKAIILMKALLRKANLHKTFQGGIGSYTISLLLIAFFRSREDQGTNMEKVFDGFSLFLKRLIAEKWLIDPEGEMPVVRENITKEPFLKHPYDGHNLLAKCYRLQAAVKALENWKAVVQLL